MIGGRMLPALVRVPDLVVAGIDPTDGRSHQAIPMSYLGEPGSSTDV